MDKKNQSKYCKNTKKLLCTFQHCCWWQLCAVDISRRCLLRWPYFDFFVTTTTWPSLFFLSVQLRVESNLHEYWESKGQPLSQWHKINNPIRKYLKEKIGGIRLFAVKVRLCIIIVLNCSKSYNTEPDFGVKIFDTY